MKSVRHNIILELVKSRSVETQEMLRELLSEKGVEVTQATLSRDIRELGLVKGSDCYYLPEKSAAEIPQLLRDSVNEIDHAVNTVVFRCQAGMAMAVCATFDRLAYSGVVGTLAGDDTIFILMRSEKEAAAFTKEMKNAILSEKKGDGNAQ